RGPTSAARNRGTQRGSPAGGPEITVAGSIDSPEPPLSSEPAHDTTAVTVIATAIARKPLHPESISISLSRDNAGNLQLAHNGSSIEQATHSDRYRRTVESLGIVVVCREESS